MFVFFVFLDRCWPGLVSASMPSPLLSRVSPPPGQRTRSPPLVSHSNPSHEETSVHHEVQVPHGHLA
eukprot:scaffold301_cov243-Pinguiococcus_pyrenoidosus.AAC.138